MVGYNADMKREATKGERALVFWAVLLSTVVGLAGVAGPSHAAATSAGYAENGNRVSNHLWQACDRLKGELSPNLQKGYKQSSAEEVVGSPVAPRRGVASARISKTGRGIGGHKVVDRLASEAQGAMSQANRILASGGSGGTRWGAIYQRIKGRGGWFENMARRNALHSISERQMLRSRYYSEAIESGFVVQFNRGSLLGKTGARGGLLRPDIQMRTPGGSFGIIDWTTEGSAGKIFKYGNPQEAPWMINVTVP